MNQPLLSLFDAPSIETTARDAAAFSALGNLAPSGMAVNIAFIGSESFDERVAAVAGLHGAGFRPRPIVSSRRLISPQVLRSYLTQSIEVGRVDGIFLVGGDPATSAGPFTDSPQVIEGGYLEGLGLQSVGIAGYPEGHPRIADEVLWRYLKRKTDALRSQGFEVEITTQLSFDAQAVVSWIKQVRDAGIDAPIRIGIPAPATMAGILNFARQCRVGTSAQLLKHYGWQLTSLMSPQGPDHFLDTLIERIDPAELQTLSLHLYPIGNPIQVLQWLERARRRRLDG